MSFFVFRDDVLYVQSVINRNKICVSFYKTQKKGMSDLEEFEDDKLKITQLW